MKRILAILLMLALTICAMPALGESALTVGVSSEPSGYFFTDLWSGNATDADVRALIHGYGLTARGADGLCRINGTAVVAHELTRLQNGDMVCTFTLSPYLLWSDGQPVTARDYAFAVLLLSSAEFRALGAGDARYDALLGWDSFAADHTSPFAGVRVNGEQSLTLIARAAAIPSLDELSVFEALPAPMRVIAPACELRDDGAGAYIWAAEGASFSAETLNETLLSPSGYVFAPSVTCGAYRLESYIAETGEITLARNPLYIGDAEGRRASLQSLVIMPISAAQAAALIKSGDIDIAARVTDGAAIAEGLQAVSAGAATSVSYARNGLAYLAFDCGEQTTAQLAVRRAIAMCIDTDRLCAEALPGSAVPVYGLYGLLCGEADKLGDRLNELDLYGYDPIGAKSILIDDGWIFNSDGAAFFEGTDELRYKMENGRMIPLELRWAKVGDSAATEYVKRQLEKAAATLGFRLVINEMSFADALAQYERRSERICNLYMFGESFSEPYDYNAVYSAGGALNRTGIIDAELERLAAELCAGGADHDERWLAFQKRWAELLPMAPLYSGLYYDFVRADVSGYIAADGWTTSVLGASGGEER